MRIPTAIAAAAMLAARAGAQAPPSGSAVPAADTFSVAGRTIGGAGERIAGARVRLASRPDLPGAVSAEDGTFRIAGVRGGGDSLIVRRLGYRPDTLFLSRQVDVGAGLVVALEPIPRRLAPVRVRVGPRVYTGPFAEFNRRRDRGFGNFITRADIVRRNAYRTSDIFRSVANLTVERAGGSNVVRMRGNRCDPLVWFDGQPLVGGFPDLDAIAPQAIEGIEIYSGAATIPPELIGPRDAGGCGVIAFWTRHGDVRRTRERPVTAEGLMALVDEGRVFTIDVVDVPAVPLPGQEPAPRHPESAADRRTDATVVAEFVVDTAGQIEPATVGIVSLSEAAFADAVREALPPARFSPALRAGRPVRQLVHQTFVFESRSVTATSGAAPPR